MSTDWRGAPIETWRAEARAWLLDNVLQGEVFSGNDLWQRGLPQPANRRLLGSVLLRLEHDGFLARTSRRTASEGGHGQPILRWQRVDVAKD